MLIPLFSFCASQLNLSTGYGTNYWFIAWLSALLLAALYPICFAKRHMVCTRRRTMENPWLSYVLPHPFVRWMLLKQGQAVAA